MRRLRRAREWGRQRRTLGAALRYALWQNPRAKSEAAPDGSLSCGIQPANISVIIVDVAPPGRSRKEVGYRTA
jgi:hypothetical protein